MSLNEIFEYEILVWCLVRNKYIVILGCFMIDVFSFLIFFLWGFFVFCSFVDFSIWV